MSKYSRQPKKRKVRRWLKNVGDPISLEQKGIANPNDSQAKQ